MAIGDLKGGRFRVRRKRRARGRFRLHKPKWVDPFPSIPGTEAEKRVFAELVARGIYFRFQEDLPDKELKESGIIQPVGYHPDFTIPEYKVILDPFSDFHHTLDEARARDRVKKVVFDAAGYASYFWWHSELIEKGAAQMFNEVIEFRKPKIAELTDPVDIQAARAPGYFLGKNVGLGAKSVAAANRARARSRRPLTTGASMRTRRRRSRRGGG